MDDLLKEIHDLKEALKEQKRETDERFEALGKEASDRKPTDDLLDELDGTDFNILYAERPKKAQEICKRRKTKSRPNRSDVGKDGKDRKAKQGSFEVDIEMSNLKKQVEDLRKENKLLKTKLKEIEDKPWVANTFFQLKNGPRILTDVFQRACGCSRTIDTAGRLEWHRDGIQIQWHAHAYSPEKSYITIIKRSSSNGRIKFNIKIGMDASVLAQLANMTGFQISSDNDYKTGTYTNDEFGGFKKQPIAFKKHPDDTGFNIEFGKLKVRNGRKSSDKESISGCTMHTQTCSYEQEN
ncbi:hypothetical protein QR680_019102 [Steinernema hermaphroditum]|uniref:Uncharacterized protein n=1 Tax=Steinernema hermaphroditum TaxID=289476 RepID=A0AA39HM42_9BILA|nr:hypothetical protein QR680_019102 [Steinernema hermaphroditum]